MSWADLDKIAVAKPRPDGRATLVLSDDRTTSSILEQPALSIVIAIGRVVRARVVVTERYEGRGLVVYRTRETPPAVLVDAVSAAGGVVFDGTREHTNPRALATTVQLDGAFVDVAANVRRRYKVGSAGDALDVLEHELRRRPIAKDDAGVRWTRIFELAALTGELVRADRAARWIAVPGDPFPLALDLGAAGTLVPGRLAHALLAGGTGSMRSLVQATAPAATKIAVQAMPLLCDRTTIDLTRTQWCPMLDVDTHDAPVIAYVNVHDDVISWPLDRGAPGPELRARALANLARIPVEITPTAMPFGTMVLATGGFFAAEKLLDPEAMRKIGVAVDSMGSILVGIPARGLLLAIDGGRASLDDAMLEAFRGAVRGEYLRATERDRITAAVIVYTDRPADCLPPADPPAG